MYKVHSIFRILNIKLSLVDGCSAKVAWGVAETKTKEIFTWCISPWFLAPPPTQVTPVLCPPTKNHLMLGIQKMLCFRNRRNKGCEISLYTMY